MLKLAVPILMCVAVYGTFEWDGDESVMDVFRLPGTTRPVSYDLRFAVRFNGRHSTFGGVTKILIVPTTNTRVVTLNAKDLNMTAVTVRDVGGGPVPKDLRISGTMFHAINEQFEIWLDESVVANRWYLVTIEYEGICRTKPNGLFISSYQEDGATKWLAVTKFEPTFARTAFPCYDEPSYKAVFNISVVKRKDQIALSNMPIQKMEFGLNNTEVVYFESTPRMSSYLAALYIGEFVPDKNGSNMTIYTQKQYVNQTEYIRTEAPKYLRVMEEYTGIKYELPKMDLLALPSFWDGAMENWGMNTFRESCLLVNEDSKAKMKKKASLIVQHEFVHQWFGNLVTCSWWDYLWLNEGFAQYFQFFATGMVKTSWPMEGLFVVDTHQQALKYDQVPRHPLTTSVNTPDEISDLFGGITYYKAASVLRMLRHLVTENLFKLSLRLYLRVMRDNSAEPKDLYASFDRVLADNNYAIGNGLTVDEFMSNWTLQAGYPVLNITKNESSNTFSIVQYRFLNDRRLNDYVFHAWHIGLTYTTKSGKNFSDTFPYIWTNKSSDLTTITAPQDSGWYIFNIQSTGFYRVNYDTDNWNALIKQLIEDHTQIHVLNRAQLIDDAISLAQAGELDHKVVFRLLDYLEKENNTIPWYTAKNGYLGLMHSVPFNTLEPEKARFKKLFGIIYKKLEHLVAEGNVEINVTSAWDDFSAFACKLHDKYCTENALKYYKKWQSGEKIQSDIRDVAFCTAAKYSTGSETFDRMVELFRTSTSISEQDSAILALDCFPYDIPLTEYLSPRIEEK